MSPPISNPSQNETATCKQAPGEFGPVIDRARCEGKSDCVRVCPKSVFEVRRIEAADFRALGIFAKLKSVASGRKTAYTPNIADCEACALCVSACPESAIKLERRPLAD